jgi:TolA-binding protein
VFLTKHPDDASTDLALLALGELQLRQHLKAINGNDTNSVTPGVAVTNHLQQALAQFDRVLAGFTNSPLRGKAFLNKGWALWIDNKPAEAALNFKAALESLPPSDDSVIARFKLADAQFKLGDVASALADYRALTQPQESPGSPKVRGPILAQALYQLERAAIQASDLSAAESAMRRLLQSDDPLAPTSLLLLGQSLEDSADPTRARQVYADFARRFPTSSLLPTVQFEWARTHVASANWPAAIAGYEDWLQRFPDDELRPDVEFSLARAQDWAGAKTNAFNLFTNFLARFPTNELARRAQFWLGDYFMEQGDYLNAQSTYQRIVENPYWPVTNISYRARFAAGRAAFKRQDWEGAGGRKGHFTLLVNGNCPEDIMADAFLALGDTKVFLPFEEASPQQSAQDRALDRQAEARATYEKIPQLFATNELARHLVPVALGRIGDCSMQLASRDFKEYANATNAYWRIVTNETAGPALRQRAEYGIGRAFALQAFDLQIRGGPSTEVTNLFSAALEHYYNVMLGAGPLAQTEPDRLWVREAGIAGAKLAEERRQWKIAVAIYERLGSLLPPLRPRLQDKLDKAREHLRLDGG